MAILISIENILAAAKNITLAQLGKDGQAVVTDAVSAAESLGGSGTGKFSAAVAQAGTDLVALGKDVSLFVLHLAVESAVTELNSPAITAAVDAVQTETSSATAAVAPIVAAPQVVPPVVAATPQPPLIPVGSQALSNALENIKNGSTVDTEASILVQELQGQGITITIDQAAAAIDDAVAAAATAAGAKT